MIKKFLGIFLLLIVCMRINAQQVTIKSVSLRQSDLKASTQQRADANGKACAIVRVGIVGVKDLVFSEAVGDVDYSLGEYIVYVPEGLQKLSYRNASGKVSGSIVFDDYGLEVETKRVYSAVLESENHMRAAIFSVQPVTAKLTFADKPVTLDKDGLAIVEAPVGEYAYHVEAEGYIGQSGRVTLTDEEISTTSNLSLEQRQYALNIKCTPANATLFIDNSPYGVLGEIQDLKLPDGNHALRLTAEGYEDYEEIVAINGSARTLNIAMTQMKERVVTHKEERTRTHVNLRPAYYISGGAELYDKNQYLGHDWGLKLSFGAMQHFAGIFSVYEGIAAGVKNLKESEKDKWFEHPADSANTWYLEAPLMVGVSIPFGKYNRHMFTVLGGGYGKAIFTEIVDSSSSKAADAHGNSYKTNYDYGLRAMAILDISRFSIGFQVSLSLAKFDKFKTDDVSASASTSALSTDSSKPNLFFGLTVGAKLGKIKL